MNDKLLNPNLICEISLCEARVESDSPRCEARTLVSSLNLTTLVFPYLVLCHIVRKDQLPNQTFFSDVDTCNSFKEK